MCHVEARTESEAKENAYAELSLRTVEARAGIYVMTLGF
jgi:hypothetical protein